jgi:hypothetical protein
MACIFVSLFPVNVKESVVIVIVAMASVAAGIQPEEADTAAFVFVRASTTAEASDQQNSTDFVDGVKRADLDLGADNKTLVLACIQMGKRRTTQVNSILLRQIVASTKKVPAKGRCGFVRVCVGGKFRHEW